MKTGIKVVDAMTTRPVTVSPSMSIKKCAILMAEKHVAALLVKKKIQLVGILTEKDIVRKAVAKGKNVLNLKAKDLMYSESITTTPGIDIFDALSKMRDENIRHLPVLDGKKLIGLLTLKDILKIQPQLFELLVEKFQLREEERKPIFNIGEKEGICQLCGNYVEKLYSKQGSLTCKDCK